MRSSLVVVAVLMLVPLTIFAAAGKKAGLPKEAAEIKTAVAAVLPALKKCYDAELKNNRNLEGRLVVEIKLDKDAAIKESKVSKDDLGSAAVATCILGKFREVKFPASAKNKTVTYPFTFAPTRTLAVLPFDNLTGDRGLDWLKAGTAESLTTKLGQVPSLVLVDRLKLDAVLNEQALSHSGAVDEKTAAKAGRLAGAERVIAGGFQRAGKKTRLTARVIDVESGKVRETAMVDGRLDDLFALQDSMAEKIADILNLPPSAERDAALALRVGSSRAILELYGKASNALGGAGEPRNPEKAKALFEQMIAADPNIPEAYFGVARALWHVQATDAARNQIRAMLEKAISLRPDYHEAITMLGFFMWHNDKIEESFALHKKALALKPDYALGHYGLAIGLASLGKDTEAIEVLRHALDLDPKNAEFLSQYAQLVAAFKRDFKTAMDYAARGAAASGAIEWNYVMLAYVQLMAGDGAACLETIEKGKKLRSPADRPEHAGQSLMLETSCLLKAGDTPKARALFAKFKDDPMFLAIKDQKLPPRFPVFVKILGSDVVKELQPLVNDSTPPAAK